MNQLSIENFCIDKSNWKKVKFGDVAFEPKESVKDPVAEGIKHVVGLEHIDSEDIHLHRSASIEESTTFTKKFAIGDVLFGRRRAYLKKAAQAGFKGICSGDITVMRATKELLPELLPFLVNNDKFFDFAITHSVGGLSPRVKFKDLAGYEFLVPPKEQQAKLAELFWTIDNTIKCDRSCLDKLVMCRNSVNNELFNGQYFGVAPKKHPLLGDIPSTWPIKALGELVDSPICYGLVQPGQLMPGGVPIVQIKNILDFSQEKMHFANPEIEKKFKRSRIASGDLLLSIKGTLGICGIVPEGFEGNIGRDSAKIRINDKVLTTYLSLLFRSKKYQDYFWRIKVGSTRHEISIDSLKKVPVIIPPTQEIMLRVIKILNDIDTSHALISEKIAKGKNLLQTLNSKVH